MDTISPAVVLATALLTVVQMHEDSWDGTAYGLSVFEAAAAVFPTDPHLTLHHPVTTLLALDWNGSIAWAGGIINAWEPGPLEVAA